MAVASAPSVLVVDDEEILLRLLRRVLERAGCRVTCARDADEAVRVFASRPGGFEAAILDVGVPPRGALSALQELRALQPDLRAILTSGSGPDADVCRALREGRCSFVAKPFSPDDLTRALDRLREETG
jgi:two-component system cell cycle sensor histidine kinase/response regulator CckA